MILAAAACAVAGAAGLSYIFDENNDDEHYVHMKYEPVTVSSTITDKQGIVKHFVHPRVINPYLYMCTPFVQRLENKICVIYLNNYRLSHLKTPINTNNCCSPFTKELSMIFYWSIPLKARLVQISMKAYFLSERLHCLERYSTKISIGVQNNINEHTNISYVQSEALLSNYDEYYNRMNQRKQVLEPNNRTFDSLSYSRLINDGTIPIGMHRKKKKSNINLSENNQKRFCHHSNQDSTMNDAILKNVSICVENLSKILSESYSNDVKRPTTLKHIPSSNHSLNNKKIQSTAKSSMLQDRIVDVLSQSDDSLEISQTSFKNRYEVTNAAKQTSDGIILQRGKRFGRTLGEPMIRKYNYDEDLSSKSFHSINELNTLLSKTNCLLMQKHHIESIEDLIRLFLELGQTYFSETMIKSFKVEPSVVERISTILLKWIENLT